MNELRYMIYRGSHHVASFANERDACRYADTHPEYRVIPNLQVPPDDDTICWCDGSGYCDEVLRGAPCREARA